METTVFRDQEGYSGAAGFHAHLLELKAVEIAHDHEAGEGHLWATEEEGEIDRSQGAPS